jgi:isopentenyl phosphate kinase
MSLDTSLDTDLVFLKLGGSLITDKRLPHTPRRAVIARLAREVKTYIENPGNKKLLLGHGSGSYGHTPAQKYGTHQGVKTPQEWKGFVEVWYQARMLNQIVIESLTEVGLPAISFPLSAGAITKDGEIETWNLSPLQSALDEGLLPVVYGDVVFDTSLGGTILSTEDIFNYLAYHLNPGRILLCGKDEGVWDDYPQCTQLIPDITPKIWGDLADTLGGASTTDVTGGMAGKVRIMYNLATELTSLDVRIFSGETPGNLISVLEGKILGTRIYAGA